MLFTHGSSDLAPGSQSKVGMTRPRRIIATATDTMPHQAMNREYAALRHRMIQRNEANAIIVHGTMGLNSGAQRFDASGGRTDTIVEDAPTPPL